MCEYYMTSKREGEKDAGRDNYEKTFEALDIIFPFDLFGLPFFFFFPLSSTLKYEVLVLSPRSPKGRMDVLFQG